MMGDHYNEIAVQKQVFKRPDPDWPFYMAEAKAGRLVLITAREKDTHLLVGYVVLLLKRHPHYQSIVVAENDLHYLNSIWRGMGNGKAMIQKAEEAAAKRGAKLFIMRTRHRKSEHGYIFEGLGYELTDLVYTKELTHAPPPPI